MTFEPLDTTVTVLLDETHRVAEDERARGQALDGKTAQITGFTGVILAIDATLGRAALELLEEPYDALFPIFFFLAIVALAVAAVSAVVGSVLPQKTRAFKRGQLEEFADGDIPIAETVAVQRSLIRTYADVVVSESKRNSRKATALQVSGSALAVGLIAVAAQAGILGIQQARNAMADNSPKKTSSPPKRPEPPPKLQLEQLKKGNGDTSRRPPKR